MNDTPTYKEALKISMERYKELEEENRKVREEVKDLVERNIELDKKYMLVLTENKKLRESDYRIQETERWKHIFTIEQNKANRKAIENTQLRKSIKKLKEKVETLELWLDNKEKLNEEYRKEIDKYKGQYEHSMGEDEELIYED